MRFGFFTDRDRTRFCYLRLRRLEKALADPSALDALLAQLEIAGQDAAAGAPRAKRAAIDQHIERLRALQGSPWHGVPAPEVLAASLFAASKRATGALAELFTPARSEQALAAPVRTWLEGGGLALYAGTLAGTGFDLVGFRKGMLSGPRVVGVIVKNDASQIDPALEQTQAFTKYTQEMHLACAPAVAAEYLSLHAEAAGRWDGEALARRLRAAGVGLLMVEGDAVAQALLPKTRPADGQALEALIAAFGAPR